MLALLWCLLYIDVCMCWTSMLIITLINLISCISCYHVWWLSSWFSSFVTSKLHPLCAVNWKAFFPIVSSKDVGLIDWLIDWLHSYRPERACTIPRPWIEQYQECRYIKITPSWQQTNRSTHFSQQLPLLHPSAAGCREHSSHLRYIGSQGTWTARLFV